MARTLLTVRSGVATSRAGVALIMTLAGLAIIAILLLALLSGASHRLQHARGSGVLVRENLLADSAIALVMGQITQASTATNQTWISQPGLLRIYSTNAVRAPIESLKLYSAAQMVDTSGTLGFVATDVPSTWSNFPSQYTDLNAPVTPSGTTTPLYPILDPAAVSNVVGMSIDSGHVAEMPVAWLYQLRDGTLGSATNGTSANPIVARIAFWTDDETCKVNINTAGSGSAWNSPRGNSTDDAAWSSNQPAAGECTAYPGHPATTALASIFTNGYSPQQLLALTPRYDWGGSQGGTLMTTNGQAIAPKTNRLYGSVDELNFGTNFDSLGNRQTNAVSAAQLEWARFFLTATSQAPETTLLGEPRFAIWPVASSTTAAAPRLTAFDRAVTNVATVGDGTTNVRSYFFQRNDPGNATNDLTTIASNAQLFSDLVARGTTVLPGYGASLGAKYSGAAWPQLTLEMVDFIRGLNAIDPNPAPFVPFAGGDSSGVGLGFVVPLTTTYGTGTSAVTLRGMGRCPTLSSLTLIFYVSGYVYKVGSVTTTIDYDGMDPAVAAASWNANFAVGSPSSVWKNVTGELVRAFIVPTTFQPGCGFPEVSDACDIQISGLNGITVTSGGVSGGFGFPAVSNSRLLSDAQKVLPVERAWGGNEGPLAWRAAAIDAMASPTWNAYPFAGTNAFTISPGTTKDSLTSGPSLPASWPNALTFKGVTGLIVRIRDRNGVTLQTLTVDLPAFTAHAPTSNGECDHADGSTSTTANPAWSTTLSGAVTPSYYMSLRNRILATQNSRSVLVQAGDVAREVEAATDLRVIAGLSTVTNSPAVFFLPHPYYATSATDLQSGSHAENIRFADGTSACFAPGEVTPITSTNTTAKSAITRVVTSANYPVSLNTFPVRDWRTGALLVADAISQIVPYTQFTSPSCSVSTGTNGVTMVPLVGGTAAQKINGDSDTGPGFAPDGAQINLPDAGTTVTPAAAYFSLGSGQIGAATRRTPNALVPSPVIFGSLPAGINATAPWQSQPWRTLLFCPYPAGDATHPGFGNATSVPPVVPDHLVLDNFWMPVVEPYGISTRLATAGKINLNDAIVPFSYLHRSTALHALLNDVRIPAISAISAATYKTLGSTTPPSIWNAIDETATIAQIESRSLNNSPDAYLSESEICTVPLVPLGFTGTVTAIQAALDSFWNLSSGAGLLTGDNLRELPFAQLYGRLTTRSNTYTVHVRVQVLQKLSADPQQNVWNEGTDLILGEWRGCYEIERYLDPSAPAPVAGQPLAPYKFRILSVRRFAP